MLDAVLMAAVSKVRREKKQITDQAVATIKHTEKVIPNTIAKSPQSQSSWDLSRQTQPMALDEQIRRRFLDFYTTFEGGLTVGCHKNVRPRIVIADPRTPHRATNLKLS